MIIYFVRHAEPNYDLSKKDTGEFPGPSLTQKGMLQVKEISSRLNKIKFDKIFCSDLKRSKQTASLLDQDVIYDFRLRETADVLNGYLDKNDFVESVAAQEGRLNSFVEEINATNYDAILIISHFNTIEYISNKFGSRIKKPLYAEINCIKKN